MFNLHHQRLNLQEYVTVFLVKPGLWLLVLPFVFGPVVIGYLVVKWRTRIKDDTISSRLHSYDMAISQAILTAQHASDQHCIPVCTKFVEPFQAQLGSLYIVLGEMEFKEGEMVLKARVFTCVEGINLQLLEKAIEEQRKYFQRRKDHEGSTS